MKTILLLGDITGRSRVALRMLSSVLERRGHEVLMLPTALISNTLNLGAHEALDTTDYLLRSLDTWEKLDLHYDMAYIGYITGLKQAKKLCAVADRLREQGVPVVLDPILGDNGKKYNSVSEGQVEGMRLLCAHADLITPNLTEACLLAGIEYKDTYVKMLAREMAEDFSHAEGEAKPAVLITSAKTSDGKDAVIGFDPVKWEHIQLEFERVPGHHWGVGDLFTGLMLDRLLCGDALFGAIEHAVQHVGAQLRGEEESLLPEQ